MILFSDYVLIKYKKLVGIYKIKNIVNNKCYYGSSKKIEERFKRHKDDLKQNKHHNIKLQRAWNKYGESNFIFELVEECIENQLLDIEQKYLNLNPEYNIGKKSSGGDNLTNNPNKEEIRKKITNGLCEKYKNMSEEEKTIRSQNLLGEKNPNWRGGKKYFCKCGKEITKQNKVCIKCMKRDGKNNPFYGKSHSENTKKELSKKLKNKCFHSNNFPVVIYKKEYNSFSEASKDLGISQNLLRWRCLSDDYKFRFYTLKETYDGDYKFSYTLEEMLENKKSITDSKRRNNNKYFIVNDTEYRTIKEASEKLKISKSTIKFRLDSKHFKNYFYKQ